MHDSLRTVESDWAWPPPRHLAPGRHRILAAAVALIIVAAAVLVSVELYGGVRRTTTPAAAPASSLAARIDPGLAEGTGIVLTPSGLVLTNNHVIEGATSVAVTDPGNHRTYAAAVVGYDQSQDIAVRRLAAASGLRTVSLRSVMDAYHPGDKAVLRWIDQAGQVHAATIVFTTGPAG